MFSHSKILFLAPLLFVTSIPTYFLLDTMYCGGEPEHKRVANKCMREEIHAHNNDDYIELHTQN